MSRANILSVKEGKMKNKLLMKSLAALITALVLAGSMAVTAFAAAQKVPAAYNSQTIRLVAAQGATAAEFSAYLKAITAVSVNGKSYNASGSGAVKVIGDDGVIDHSKLNYGTNNVVVTATGYPKLSFQAAKLFIDVTDYTAWYFSPVYWAANNGITVGYGGGKFKPYDKLTRAMTVTFLYNFAGKPDVSDLENPFSDVTENDWYYAAVKWAYKNQITSGYGKGIFKPNDTCTRGMIVTFIRHYAEFIDKSYVPAKKDAPFKDVKSGDWFKESVDWAYEIQLTSGYGNNVYQPYAGCTRGMMVTFLYKYDLMKNGN